jgi:hypothetical protein
MAVFTIRSDAGRRTWSGSQSIFINAMTNAAPGEFSTNLQQLYRPSEISINNGYLSSVNYNAQPGTPARWTTNTNWKDQANSIFPSGAICATARWGAENHQHPPARRPARYARSDD